MKISSSEGQFDAAFLNGLVYEQLYYPLSRVEGVATCHDNREVPILPSGCLLIQANLQPTNSHLKTC